MFLISIMFAIICLIISICINIPWIIDIACFFGYFVAIYLVTFIALIPGFNYIFTLISLLFCKNEKNYSSKKDEDVTILIPVYNAKNSIEETIESIKKQKYCGNIYINIIDDGSTDGTLELLKNMNLDSNITIIEVEHQRKSHST